MGHGVHEFPLEAFGGEDGLLGFPVFGHILHEPDGTGLGAFGIKQLTDDAAEKIGAVHPAHGPDHVHAFALGQQRVMPSSEVLEGILVGIEDGRGMPGEVSRCHAVQFVEPGIGPADDPVGDKRDADGAVVQNEVQGP